MGLMLISDGPQVISSPGKFPMDSKCFNLYSSVLFNISDTTNQLQLPSAVEACVVAVVCLFVCSFVCFLGGGHLVHQEIP
jgi:hypothetical protein